MTRPSGDMQVTTEADDDNLGLAVRVRWTADMDPQIAPHMAGSAVSDAVKALLIQPGLDEQAIMDLRRFVRQFIQEAGPVVTGADDGELDIYRALSVLESAISGDTEAVRLLARELFGRDSRDA
ncbi:MAG: hypothetical protein ACRDZY_16875 [Acidimicrobiales bacterium]